MTTTPRRSEDTVRLRAATAVIADIRRDVSPVVTLTDERSSRTARETRRRPARIWVSRDAVDGAITVLGGEVAHEYAHLIDPLHRRDTALRVAPVFVVGPIAATAVTFPQLQPGAPDWLIVAIWMTGLLLGALLALWIRHVSHRVELRADRTAVELLGSVEPVLAMLERFDGLRADQGLPQRIQAWLTHPSPDRRRRALTAP